MPGAAWPPGKKPAVPVRYYDGLPVPTVKSVDFSNDAVLCILLRGC